MNNIEKYLKILYQTNEYIIKNPSLHVEDSHWKVSKIIPLINKFLGYIDKDEINLLDVGGGAGLILKTVSQFIEKKDSIIVNKFALDLSPSMLEIQKKINPDFKKALNEDIRKTSLGNKDIDLTLMIDILEHVPTPTKALEEIKRISNFVIFKVPLDDNLSVRTWNFINKGKPRHRKINVQGHINIYNFSKLKYQIDKHNGRVLDFNFSNVFEYFRQSKYHRNNMNLGNKIVNILGTCMFRLSPNFCSHIFHDFVIVLVKCY